ncbi:hypothetical protein ES703_48292 [subsurface metagenome]
MADDELKSPEVEESGQSGDRVTELEDLMAQKDEELAKANARIVELEQTVANLDSEVVSLKQALAESEERLTTINHSLAEAVAVYKDLVAQSNPEVPEELITGDTIEAINESLEKAKTLVNRVKQGLEAEITAGKVPAGAPIRTPPDLSALSPREKINYAIGGKI